MNFNNTIDSIMKHEGFVPKVYKDKLGYDTIGYGFKVSDLDLTEMEAKLILCRKVKEVCRALEKKYIWFVELPEPIQDVFVEMAYQLGVSGFGKFKKMIKHAKSYRWTGVCQEMLFSVWYTQTPNRVEALCKKIEAYYEDKD